MRFRILAVIVHEYRIQRYHDEQINFLDYRNPKAVYSNRYISEKFSVIGLCFYCIH